MQTIVYAALVNLSPAPATPILDRLESSPLWVRVVAARAAARIHFGATSNWESNDSLRTTICRGVQRRPTNLVAKRQVNAVVVHEMSDGLHVVALTEIPDVSRAHGILVTSFRHGGGGGRCV